MEVTGKVVNQENNTPIAGASVYAKSNPEIKTHTDEKGNFVLKLPEGETHVVVSADGYTTIEYRADAGNELLVKLKSSENVIEQVVITALGVKRWVNLLLMLLLSLKEISLIKLKRLM
jgi:hypothetical protein